MKVCPACGKIYRDDTNYCLDDGARLQIASDAARTAAETLRYGAVRFDAATNENRAATAPAPGANVDFNRASAGKAGKSSGAAKIVLASSACLLVFVLLSGYFIYAGIADFRSDERETNAAPNRERADEIPVEVPTTPPLVGEDAGAQATITVGERVKDRFGRLYIKCTITNTGENVIESPFVRLHLYKNDVKIDEVAEFSDFKFLKPQQTVPVWVSIAERHGAYTAARVDETNKQRAAEESAAELFPVLVYGDPQMSVSRETALVNFKPVLETYYTVKGTIENRLYDAIEPRVYVLFYDADGEVVGIGETHPPPLRKNEKAEFTASVGNMGLFGTPTRFEVIAVKD